MDFLTLAEQVDGVFDAMEEEEEEEEERLEESGGIEELREDDGKQSAVRVLCG